MANDRQPSVNGPEDLLRRHAERLGLSMVEERHEVSRALFDLLNEVVRLRKQYAEVNEYAKRRGNNADGWQERAMKAEADVKRLRNDSAWLMETWLYEYTNLDQGERHIVDHSCDFALRPDIGACDFHEKWFGIAERNGMMDEFAKSDEEAAELSEP